MDICVDIETLSTKPNATVLAIGACMFDPYIRKPIAGSFLGLIKKEDAFKYGVVDQNTSDWWDRQDKALQKIIFGGSETSKAVAVKFASFVSKQAPDNVWANSPSFDCVILQTLFEDLEVEWPFSHRQERDVRTVCAMARDLSIALPERSGGYMPHHPLGDAIGEAMQVQAVLSTMQERFRYTPKG